MLLVNPSTMGIPAASGGAPVQWTRIFIGNVYPLAPLGNTTLFASASDDPGYMATLTYTYQYPDYSASLRLADFSIGEDFISGSFTPGSENLASSLRFSDWSIGESYIAGSFTPEAANLSGSLLLADWSLGEAYALYVPEGARLQSSIEFTDGSLGESYTAYLPESANLAASNIYLDPMTEVFTSIAYLPANVQAPRIEFDETGAYAA